MMTATRRRVLRRFMRPCVAWPTWRWIAPEFNNSAKSNALTLYSPLVVQRAANGFRYIDGTPADCVHIALTGLLSEMPDLVVSASTTAPTWG